VRRFAFSYYLGMFLLAMFICISLLSHVVQGLSEWLDELMIGMILAFAIALALWAAWRAEPRAK
jgi:hypothetical protein